MEAEDREASAVVPEEDRDLEVRDVDPDSEVPDPGAVPDLAEDRRCARICRPHRRHPLITTTVAGGIIPDVWAVA